MEENKTLASLVDDQLALDELMVELAGEITDDKIEETTSKWMAEIKSGIAAKIDNYGRYQEVLAAQETKFYEQAERLKKTGEMLGKISQSLKDRLKWSMQEMQTFELKGERYKYKLNPSAPSVVIKDQAAIPATYAREKLIIEIDKKAIKADIEDGRTVPGAALERGWTLRVNHNKG